MTNDIKNQDSKYRPLVYVCSAYSGDVTANVKKARQYCRFALEQGQIPLAPHLLFPQFVNEDDPAERELAIFMDVISRCISSEKCMTMDCFIWMRHGGHKQRRLQKMGRPTFMSERHTVLTRSGFL